MSKSDFVHRMERLLAERRAFVTATVVRAAKPTSVRPGDAALILPDGTIDGFVGGHCAQASVRLHAARVLETGDAVLLRLLPGMAPGEEDGCAHDGIIVAHNPCLRGGALEIFLEPQLAAPRVVVAGDTPIARALEAVASAAGYDVVRDAEPMLRQRGRQLRGGADVGGVELVEERQSQRRPISRAGHRPPPPSRPRSR
jgi:xanthine dehydrogenase accessory factor